MADQQTPPHGVNSFAARDIAAVLHPYTNLELHEKIGPLVITGGDGVHVIDEQGKRYIEAMAGLWCASLGFSERRLADAAAKQMTKLPYYHLFGGKSHDRAIELAETLIAMAPLPMSHVFFADSGSEAVDTAIKFVWYYNNAVGRPAKKKIISRQKGYHGVTVAAASLTALPANHRSFDLPREGFLQTDCPHYYRYGLPGESEEQFADRLMANLEAQIVKEGADTVAAFIAEPVQGAGGVIVPPRTYFAKLQALLKKYDILFIADEVITGFGRTGNMFGSTTFELQPDMITLAKALSSGYMPISAVMINEKLYKAFVSESGKIGTFGHGFTYSAHPVPAAVALETLRIYQERDIVSHIRKVGPLLQDGLRKFADHPLVGEVRGIGLVAGVELVADKATKAPFEPYGKAGATLIRHAQAHGLITRALGDTIAFSPPLIIQDGEIAALLERFGKALDGAHGELTAS
ncbi:MAG TPA: aspartate aminotransferase family protein [Alphaproteobacteria bacterium]|nr:aspartate aminotransferase family protein [Alphaproteobacteria bacterium]